MEPTVPQKIANKIAQRWAHWLENRQAARYMPATTHETVTNARELPPSPRRYVIGDDDDVLCQGIMNTTIPSTVVDSGCTLGVGTRDDPCQRIGVTSNKEFMLPGGEIKGLVSLAPAAKAA